MIRHPHLACWCALALAFSMGCKDASHSDNPVATGARKGKDRPVGSGEDVFAARRILDLRLELPPAELESLKKNKDGDNYTYVECTVREGDQSWDKVGLRTRGTPAKEFETGKPDLIVTFNKYNSKQRYHGQRRLILQGSLEDPSYLAAPMAMESFRAAGVPAPRCGFARVQLNGSALGLYVVLENGADGEFLEQHFSKSSGNLYDEGKPPDVTGKLQKARGKDRDDQSDVDALAAAAAQSDPAVRWKELQQRLDVDKFLNFIALEILWWQDDSYSLDAAKFRLYHDPESDRLVFFPKAVERVLRKTDGPLQPDCLGVVAKAVLGTPEGRQRYRAAVSNLLENVFVPSKVEARARELSGLIRPALPAEGSGNAQDFDKAVARLLERMTKRAEFAATQLKSVSGER